MLGRSHAITTTLLGALGAAIAFGGCSQRSYVQANPFVWSGPVATGHWLRIRNLTGYINVEPTTGTAVEVATVKRWHYGGDAVRFVQDTSDGDVLVCTMYGDGGHCTPSTYAASGHHSWWRIFGHRSPGSSDASVDYIVRVPAGVAVDLRTVNGKVSVQHIAGAVTARSVNGNVDVATTQAPVNVETVNGSVSAHLDSLAGAGDVRLATVNGSVVAKLPDDLNGTLNLETVNGRLTTDYPLTVNGQITPRHIQGTLGAGGRQVKLTTVNGNVSLKKT